MQSWITPFDVPELEVDFYFLFLKMSGLMLLLCVWYLFHSITCVFGLNRALNIQSHVLF